MVKKYKNTKYYNWKHPSQEKILHMIVRKVIDSLEKGLTDSKTNDFIAQFIKIIKVEKHETWSSFWKKIWQSLWKKK
jgi:DNA-binding ferritin-like protein (Dps family)